MNNSAWKRISAGRQLAYILAVVNALVIGVSFIMVKMTLEHASPFDTLMYRFAAAFVLLVATAASGYFILNYRGKPVYKLLLLSTMYPMGFFMFQTFGLQHATSAEGGIINALTPIVTLVLATVFLKEATTHLQKLSILLSVAGVVFIFIMKGSGIDISLIKGIVLLIVACVVFAGYSVFARSVTKYFSPAEITCFMVGIAFPLSLAFSITTHASAGTLENLVTPLTNSGFILIVLYLGAVQLATALMGNYILSKIEASISGVFINLSTIVSIAAGALVLEETIAWYHICGSILIITGVVGTNLLGRKSSTQAIRFAIKKVDSKV